MPTVGRIKSEIQSYRYSWKIDTFELYFLKTGRKIKSPKFEATFNDKEFEWQIWLYPKGVRSSDGKSISIGLYNFSMNVVTADVWFGLVDHENKVVHIKSIDKKTYDTRKVSDSTWTITEFANEGFISRDNNLIHGHFKVIIECQINVYAAHTRVREIKEVIDEEQENTLRFREFDKYEHLMNDDVFSDVSFIIEGKRLKAHKCILVKSSPVFAAMFLHEMIEKRESTVRINDMRLDVFVEMLRFIYAGKINLQVYGVKYMPKELLIAADKYSIDGLRNMCTKLIYDNLCIDNAVEILVIADRHQVQCLRIRAMKLIVLHKKELNDVPDFELLTGTPAILYEVCHAIANHKKFLGPH